MTDTIEVRNPFGQRKLLSKSIIVEMATRLDCGCPQELLDVLEALESLQKQQIVCIANNPSGFITHSWLLGETRRAAEDLTRTFIELLRRENILTADLDYNEVFRGALV